VGCVRAVSYMDHDHGLALVDSESNHSTYYSQSTSIAHGGGELCISDPLHAPLNDRNGYVRRIYKG
jgi:hypothetical protein